MAVWSAVILQLVLPVVAIAWLGLSPARYRFLYFSAALAVAFSLVATGLAVPALILPWWLPWLLLALLIVTTAAGNAFRAAAAAPALPPGIGGRLVTGAMLLLALAAGWISLVALAGRASPGVAAVDMPLPLGEGTYLVASGGSREIVNGHMLTLEPDIPRFRDYRGQSYGVDLVRIGRFGLRAPGLRPSDPTVYAIYGDPVYAPCDGRVLQSRADRPDMPVPQMDREVLAGNFVLLRCDDVELLLAHLVPGSVQVSPGDRVRAGDRLGEVGNSGQTAEPHLHVSAQTPGTAEAPFSGEPLAIRFDGRFVARNDRLRVRSPPGTQSGR